MIQMFIKHILGINSEHKGLYGDTSAYYGTVEQQGRLSLHLHMLLWIKGAVTPEDIHRCIKDPKSAFSESLVKYLESCYAGEYITGPQQTVEENVEAKMASDTYEDPTETMPVPTPKMCTSLGCEGCDKCAALASWTQIYHETVDDLLLKSNVHVCKSNKKKDGSQNKLRPFTGCLDNIWQKCKARFPRLQHTTVDRETGRLDFKKKEPMINTFTYPLTYLFRCNTDVTSLHSGTAIKAVLLYISNYITKPTLKTHVIFDAIRAIFQKNAELLAGDAEPQEKAPLLMTKIVNCLSAKMEMGSPMICMYLLDNPDHYSSHVFVPFYWQSFVSKARATCNTPAEQLPQHSTDDIPEKVAILRQQHGIVPFSPVDDYLLHAPELERVCLYDWVSCCQCVKSRAKKSPPASTHIYNLGDDIEPDSESDDRHRDGTRPRSTLLKFLPEHPFSATHASQWLPPDKAQVPNFIGATIPQRDQGDPL
jgi:hypothetical protein